MKSEIEDLNRKIQAMHPQLESVRKQVARVIVGQIQLIDRLLIGLLANGHVLVEGVPGLAKPPASAPWDNACTWSSSGSSSRPTCCPAT